MKSILFLFFTLFSFLTIAQDLTEVQKQQVKVNYLKNGGFENGKAGWATYSDTAGTQPVDGTGGTANVTLTTSTTNPHNGKVSAILTKDAVNRQGQGFSYNFSIPDIAKGKVNRVNFTYEITSGTYATGDLSVWIYDVTNARMIQPSAYTVENSSLKESKFLEFQSSIDSNSYRLIVHVTSTSASAYTVKFDDFDIGLTPKIWGSVVTDPVSFTPVTPNGSFGTITSPACIYWREGQFLNGHCKFTAGTTTGSIARISLPNLLTIGSVGTSGTFVAGQLVSSAVGTVTPHVLATAGNNFIEFGYRDSSTNSLGPVNANSFVASGVTVEFSLYNIPIQGWSSSQQLSQDADTRVVKAQVKAPTSATGCGTNIPAPFSVVAYDTHGAYNNSTYTYTVPSSGYYDINADEFFFSGTDYFYLYKNGAKLATLVYANSTYVLSGGVRDYFIAGDQLTFRCSANPNINYSAGNYNARITITKNSGPSQISASETISASYWLSANFVASSSTPVNFDSKDFDTHNAVTTSPTAWRFTAPAGGIYIVSGYATFNTAYFKLYKNGSSFKMLGYSTLSNPSGGFSVMVRLLAGEYIDLRPAISATATGGNAFSDGVSNISITRIGL